MDAETFDTATRRLSGLLSRRRSLGALAALGVSTSLLAEDAAAKKKKTTLCLNGQTITTSSKKKRKKLLKNGATTGACVPPGPPPCTPINTCAGLGRTCGPLDDGCGRTLVCGRCTSAARPSCRTIGECGACYEVCPPSCPQCTNRSDGGTTCTHGIDFIPCTACTTDADCPGTRPTCVSTTTVRGGSGTTTSIPALCSMTSPGVCASIAPCVF